MFQTYEIPIRSKKYPKEVPVFIEIKKGSRMKYEWDKDIGMLRLDHLSITDSVRDDRKQKNT